MVEGEIRRFFRTAPAFGVWSFVSTWFAPHACTQCPTLRFTVFGAYYCRCGAKIENWANYGFVAKCLFVRVGSVVVLVILRNYLGVVIGTWHILADLYWLVCDDI